MRKLSYLFIAIIGNALGTALMNNTNLGMTAWGSSAKNISNLFSVSIGIAFIILSIVFYSIALLIKKEFKLRPFIESFLFLFGFALFSDLFIYLIPDLSQLHFVVRLIINISGLLILLLSIAIHLKLQLAVHPMDVYLYEMQLLFQDVRKGTYLSYFSAFLVALATGLLHGMIEGIGIGTIITLLTSGMIMYFYNKVLLKNLIF